MKKIILLLLISHYSFSQITQIGSNIDGEAAHDKFGYPVSLSSDGTIVAIGAFGNDGMGTDAGHVRVYEWDGSAWVQRGRDIDGEAAGDYSGISVSLSSDGSIVAIGAWKNNGNGKESGHVRVYGWNGSAWVQRGSDIDGEAADDHSGRAVSLSSDGTIVAIGAYTNDANDTNSGHVRVYKWNGSSWVQKGSDLDGDAFSDNHGISVSLSSDGTIVAIGSSQISNDSGAGYVRVYEWDGSAWVQRGDDIDGEAAGDNSGRAVSLSSDGTIVAIGAPKNRNRRGHVRVYEWDGSAWVQRGIDLDGSDSRGSSGNHVSLNSDGSVLAIGASSSSVNGEYSGQVRVYNWDGSAWVQIGKEIYGEAGDFTGALSLSSDASILAVGAYQHDGSNGTNSGNVRVFEIELDTDGDGIINSEDLCYLIPNGMIGHSLIDGKHNKTTDGGENWTKTNDDYTFDNISFINENSGYGIIEGAPHMTSDGGTTWVKTSDTVNITDISFASVSVGFALIDGKTHQTSDDGVTWEKKNDNLDFDKISFVTEKIGYGLVGGANYKTLDAGVTWTNTNSELSFSEISYAYANIGYGLVDGKSYKTTDSGVRWAKTNDNYDLSDISFLYENIGYGVIDGFSHKTIDGGVTWTKTSDTPNLNAISFTSNQNDKDGDGLGNPCDPDDDDDGLLDVEDNCRLVVNPDQLDTDNDGKGDLCDSDDDNDGVSDNKDNCSLTVNPDQLDTDADGVGDLCDDDDDGDGIKDEFDTCPNTPDGATVDANGCADSQKDTDGDGVTDDLDTCSDSPDGATVDANGCADSQKDTDGDGIFDDVDNCPLIANPDQADWNNNGVGDVCGDPKPLFTENVTFVENIYPNPTDDKLTISIKPGLEIRDLYFIDLSGKLLKPKSISWSRSNLEINVSNLEEGIYILEIVSDREVDKVKVVIER